MSVDEALARLSGDRRASPAQRWLWLAAVLGTALLVVYPLGMFLVGSFRSAPWGDAGAAWTFAGYVDAYTDAYTWKLVGNTLVMTATVATATVILSFLISLVVVRSKFWGRKLLDQLVFMWTQ